MRLVRIPQALWSTWQVEIRWVRRISQYKTEGFRWRRRGRLEKDPVLAVRRLVRTCIVHGKDDAGSAGTEQPTGDFEDCVGGLVGCH